MGHPIPVDQGVNSVVLVPQAILNQVKGKDNEAEIGNLQKCRHQADLQDTKCTRTKQECDDETTKDHYPRKMIDNNSRQDLSHSRPEQVCQETKCKQPAKQPIHEKSLQ